MKQLSLALFTIFFCTSLNLHGQDVNKSSKIIPPSPNAASLGLYGEIPVSNYTGKPDISIPLYNIEVDNFNLPLSLNYDASGIKVEQEASWVGLGWSLSAGGVITRTIKGMDDLGLNGYPFNPIPTDQVNFNLYLQKVADGLADPEPDIFYFNFAGRSGKFVISSVSQGEYTFSLFSQEKIRIRIVGNDAYGAPKWELTTEDGVKYLFNTPEFTISQSSSGASSELAAEVALISNPLTASSWYLDKIIYPTGNEINFQYESGIAGNFSSISLPSGTQAIRMPTQVIGSPTCNTWMPQTGITYYCSRNIYFDVYLKKITCNEGYIEFVSSSREDIQKSPVSGREPQKLSQVNIFKTRNNESELLKSFIFNYSYFNASSLNSYADKRLKLAALYEKNGSLEIPPYSFDYIVGQDNEMPAKNSKSRDYWGYFNGKNNDQVYSNYLQTTIATLIPPFSIEAGSLRLTDAGANRNADGNFSSVGTLSKITYPTGGSSSFTFEPHDYFTTESVAAPVSFTVFGYGPLVQDPPANVLRSKVFDIKTRVTPIKINLSFYCYLWQEVGTNCVNKPSHAGELWQVAIDGSRTLVYSFPIDNSKSDYTTIEYSQHDLLLQPGTYEIKPVIQYDGWAVQMDVSYEGASEPVAYNKQAGGIRIKSLTNLDPITQKELTTRFEYLNASGTSSGLLMNAPFKFDYNEVIFGGPCDGSSSWEVSSIIRKSSSNYPLGTAAGGGHIGYGSITMYKGDEIKISYTYRNNQEQEIPGPALPDEPTIAPNSNGQLLTQTEFVKRENVFYPQVVTVNDYAEIPALAKTIPAIKAHSSGTTLTGGINGTLNFVDVYKRYSILSEKWNLKTETITTIDANNNSLQKIKNYFYENNTHLQVTRMEEILSPNKTLITKFAYPADYSDTESDDVNLLMKNELHMHSSIVQSTDLVVSNGISSIVKSGITRYGQFPGRGGVNVVQPLQQARLRNRLLAESDLPRYLPSTGLENVTLQPFFEKEYSYRYDVLGNLSDVIAENSYPVSFFWSGNPRYPVARASNSTSNEMFFDGFENTSVWGQATWPGGSAGVPLSAYDRSVSHSGRQSGKLYDETVNEISSNSNIWLNINPGSQRKFKYSCWVLTDGASGTLTLLMRRAGEPGYYSYADAVSASSPGKWMLLEKEFEIPPDVTQLSIQVTKTGPGAVWFDDIRLHPSNAQMNTYTYDPLVGMISETDTNNRTTYYEYDELNRLKNIRDNERNIVKRFQYEYAK